MLRYFGIGLALVAGVGLWAQNNPVLPDKATKLSEHIYVIEGWPNVGIVVGDRATLVIDTGLGPRNGATVMKQVQRLAKGSTLYLTTTHFHPEHAAGDAGFPANTILIRPAVQQQEMEAGGNQFVTMFRGRNAQFGELLSDVKLRPPDVVFDRELKLDLGGVTARLMWLGGGHTRGDEEILVEPDSALFSGDIVESKLVPSLPGDGSSVKGWLAILDRLEELHPKLVVPDHGALGDGSLVPQEKAFLGALQSRAMELKKQGISADEAGKTLTAEMKAKHPDWESMAPVANVVRRVYAETP